PSCDPAGVSLPRRGVKTEVTHVGRRGLFAPGGTVEPKQAGRILARHQVDFVGGDTGLHQLLDEDLVAHRVYRILSLSEVATEHEVLGADLANGFYVGRNGNVGPATQPRYERVGALQHADIDVLHESAQAYNFLHLWDAEPGRIG